MAARRQRFKVCLLGEGRVGKTSILLRYVKDSFDDRQASTMAASYLDKNVTVGTKSVKLSIWDTAGQERYHALGPLYYRDADGALLVYDITDDQSFERVQHWVKELRKIVGSDIAIAIAGNKCDLEKDRHVNRAQAEKYAKSVGAQHFHTSAKTNKGLDTVFVDLVQRMLTKGGGGGGAGAGSGGGHGAGTRSGRGGKKLVISDDDGGGAVTSGKKEGGCC